MLPYHGKDKIFYSKKLNLAKTGLESLDDLIERLLEINPDKRISFEEYYNHNFFKETQNVLQNTKIKRDKNIRNKNSEE